MRFASWWTLALALLLVNAGPSPAADRETLEKRSHVDFNVLLGDESGALPRVSVIKRSLSEKTPASAPGDNRTSDVVESEEIVLVDAGETRYVFRQRTDFPRGRTEATLRVIWGPDSSDELSAVCETLKASGLAAWMAKVRGKEYHRAWIEATVGGRVFFYPEESWVPGAIEADVRRALEEAVHPRLRAALEELDSLVQAGYVSYRPYLVDVLLFPILHQGEELRPSSYSNLGTQRNESAIYFGKPDCDFDATFGEICPASIRMAQERPGDAPKQLAP